jgi:hypothetical protein
MHMLTGTPELFLFTWLLLLLMWAGQCYLEKEARLKFFLRFPAIVALVTALTAVQLLPFLELLKHSQRQASFGGTDWAMPPWGWANFLVPLFRMAPTWSGVYLQVDQGVFSSCYLGVGTLAFAVLGLWFVRRPIVWMCGVVLVLSLILSLGSSGHLYDWFLKVLPFVGFMRYPVKLVLFAGCVVPLLAAFLLSRFFEASIDTRHRIVRGGWVISAVFILLMGAIVWFSFRFPGVDESPSNTLTSALGRAIALCLIIAILHAMATNQRPRLQTALQAGLLLLVWGELISHAPRQNPTVSPDAFRLKLPPLEELSPRPSVGASRVMAMPEALLKLNSTIVSNAFDCVLGVRLGLYHNCNLLEKIAKADGFYALYLAREQAIRARLFWAPGMPTPAITEFLAVSHVMTTNAFLRWQNTPHSMPIITVGQNPVFATSEEAVTAMGSTNFRPREVVYLPLQARSFIAASNRTGATILSSRMEAHRIDFEVESPAPALVVISQMHYQPWHAYVDGAPVKIWPANYAFQAVEIPPGRHQIRLIYRDYTFVAGSIISATTVAGCLLAWNFSRRRERFTGLGQPSLG